MPVDERSSIRQVSRRQFLVAGSVFGVTALSGCSASASSNTPDCTTSAVEHGEGDVLQQASTSRSESSIILLVTLKQSATDLPVSRLEIRNSENDLLHEIPATGSREYRQNLGHPPGHDYLKIVAKNQQDEEIDSLAIEYSCPATE